LIVAVVNRGSGVGASGGIGAVLELAHQTAGAVRPRLPAKPDPGRKTPTPEEHVADMLRRFPRTMAPCYASTGSAPAVVAPTGGLVEWVKPSEGRNNESEAR
jgi:hypothetical protein